MEERELDIGKYRDVDQVIIALIAEREKGNHVFCNFNGHILHSDTVTVDSAYLEVVGCTYAEYLRLHEEWLKNFDKKKEERELKEAGYAKKVAASRSKGRGPITMDEVVAGLRFIAENRNATQDELIDGLLDLGCNFTFEDIEKQFPNEVLLFEGITNGDISCGASVIANMRDSEYGRSYGDDRFLTIDNDDSIYHFVRIVTGDESFTKENIETKVNGKKK